MHVDPRYLSLFHNGAGRQHTQPALLIKPGQRLTTGFRSIGPYPHRLEDRGNGGLRYERMVSFPVPELPGYSQAFRELIQLSGQV